MQHTAAVRERERLADLLDEPQALGYRAMPVEIAIEPRAFDELHGVERATVGKRARFVDGHDGGMLQVRDYARFVRRVQHLDGHAAPKLRVERGIDHAQSAPSDLAVDLVARTSQIGKIDDLA